MGRVAVLIVLAACAPDQGVLPQEFKDAVT
jgi:hypothetical protein